METVVFYSKTYEVCFYTLYGDCQAEQLHTHEDWLVFNELSF